MSTEDSSPTGTGGDDSPSVSEPESVESIVNLDESLVDVLENGEGQSDDPHVEVLAEYVEKIEPVLTNRLEWARKNAKSSMAPYYKYDQSMLAHTRDGVFFLTQFIGEIISEDRLVGLGDKGPLLRKLVALFVVHDVHKIRDGPDEYDEEFNIDRREIESFIEQTGLDEFAPNIDLDTFQSVAIGLHKGDNSKMEMLTNEFSFLKPFLRLADTIASLNDPEDFVGERQYKNFYDVVKGTSIPHTHAIDDSAGSLASVANKAMAETFEEYGYDLLTIHETGCTYAGPSDIERGEIPDDPDKFIDTAYNNFVEELRKALPRYRNRSILADAAELRNGQGRYGLSSLDILCLSKPDVIQAVVEHGITDAGSPFDLSNSASHVLDVLEEMTDVEFDRTHRIEGVARIVHTIRKDIIPELMEDDKSLPVWRRNPDMATMVVFDISDEMASTIASLHNETYDSSTGADSLAAKTGDWAYKYLIAQDILDGDRHFIGEGSDETIRRLTNDITSSLSEFDRWSDFRERTVGHIDEELRATLLQSLRVDGEKFHVEHGVPEKVEAFLPREKNECGLCESRTVAAQEPQPELVEAPLYIGGTDNVPKQGIPVEYNGESRNLRSLCLDHRLCFSCQIDIELQAADTSWEDINEPRLHITLRPEYSYTPISGIIFTHILDRYSSASSQRGADFAKEVFLGATDEQASYDEMMATHAQNAFGREMLSNLERGFMLGSGYGAHSVSFPLPKGDGDEALFAGVFAAVVAASYSGISAYISDKPILRTPDEKTRELIQFSSSLKSIHSAFGGDSIPLHEMNTILKATSAIRRLAHATGHGHAPISTYCDYKQNHDYPLVGSQMLSLAVENGADPSEYAVEATHLDAHSARDNLFADSLVKDAAAIADYAVEILDYPDDMGLVRDLVDTAIDVVVDGGRTIASDALIDDVEAEIQAHPEVNLSAFGTIEGLIREFSALLVTRVLNNHLNGSPSTLDELRDPLLDGVWTHSIALCNTNRDPFEDAP